MSSLHVELLLERTHLPSGSSAPAFHVLVRLKAGKRQSERPPVDLVACLDVSLSMRGAKLHAARLTAEKLVRELEEKDRLGLVSFSSEARAESALQPMNASGQEDCLALVRRLQVRDNTNMSAGLQSALSMLRRSEGEGKAQRRVLFFTDGHANLGLDERDREGWAALTAELGDLSVSWFGYGEDHDAPFLSWLADRTRGNAYVVRNEAAIAEAFAQEVGALLGTVVQSLRVRLIGKTQAPLLLNEEPSKSEGTGTTVELSELMSEESRDLLFELPVSAGHPGEKRELVGLELSWVETDSGRKHGVLLEAGVQFVSPTLSEAPRLEVREAWVLQNAARAMRQAATCAEGGDYARAGRLLADAALLARRVPTERAQDIAGLLTRLAREYGDRELYASNRSRLAGIHRSFSKQKTSGSEVDAYFQTETQRRMIEKFTDPEGEPKGPKGR